jgi:hypothetical protein
MTNVPQPTDILESKGVNYPKIDYAFLNDEDNDCKDVICDICGEELIFCDCK